MKKLPTSPRFLKGRFHQGLSHPAQQLNSSIFYDWRLIAHDLWQNRVYSEELLRLGVIPRRYASVLKKAWDTIESEIRQGTFPYLIECEDVHLNLERRVTEIAGDLGSLIHTGRSRNDQVATVFRLWLRDAGDLLYQQIQQLTRILLLRALRSLNIPFPGYTHLQLAEWISFGHYLHAYAVMFYRDLTRYSDARHRLNYLPLGSGALAGSSLPLQRDRLARRLGFEGVTTNSLDAVSDRDFVLEFLSFATIFGLHLSRMMEEFILFSTHEFSLIRLPETLCTGSSLLPHKYNPDLAEIIRGKSGEILGSLLEVSIILKGLPLAYNKDLQGDKLPVFRVVETLFLAIPIVIEMVKGLKLRHESFQRYMHVDGLSVPALLDYLLFRNHIPFRKAHELLGSLVRLAEDQGKSLRDLLPSELSRAGIPRPSEFRSYLLSLRPEQIIAEKKSVGSPSPSLLEKQILKTQNQLKLLPRYKAALPWAFTLPPPRFVS